MFEQSYFDRLQDYVQSGFDYELTPEEQEYYNALFAVVGINRKYGKDQAVAFLMHPPFNCSMLRAREMYNEAINLFFADDSIEPRAHRQMLFENLEKAALVVLRTAKTSKDMEVYGNLLVQAAKIKQLDKPDPVKRREVKEKEFKVYTLDSNLIGIPMADRNDIAAQIDAIQDISAADRNRLKQDAGVIDINFEEMLDDTQEKTSDKRQ